MIKKVMLLIVIGLMQPLYAKDPEAARREELQYRSRIHEEIETGRMDRATGERLKAQERARQLKANPPPRPDNPQLNR